MNKKSVNRAFHIGADTKFNRDLLITTFATKKTTKGSERTLKMSYDGLTSWSYECEVTGTKQFQDKTKDLVICTKVPAPGPYGDLPHNRAMSAAFTFFRDMSDELQTRYLRDTWYLGTGSGGEGGIQPFSGIVKDESGNEVLRKYMPEERFRPLVSPDAFGINLDVTIYNYLVPRTGDFPPAVVYKNARTMDSISPGDIMVATYPAFGYTEGSTVQVRPLTNKTWHAMGNTALVMNTPFEELKKCRIPTCRARVEVGYFSSCNPKSKLSRYAWSIKMTLGAIELFVPQRRTMYLPPGPTRDIFSHAKDAPAFIADKSPAWVRLFCEENEKYRLKMAAQYGGGEPEEAAVQEEEVAEHSDEDHRDKKQKTE